MELEAPPHSGKAIVAAVFVLCCMQFIRHHEGELYKAYPDTGSVWTICDGHTRDVKKGDVATKAQCQQFLKDDTIEAIATFEWLTDKAPVPPQAKKVFVDEIFNAGAGNFQKSTMRRLIKAGDYAGACRQFPRWKYVDGHDCNLPASHCRGIIVRRQEQMTACLKGLQ